MKNKAVIYTAIVGDYDQLNEPEVKPAGCDFVCFTDQDIESETWEVRKIDRQYGDSTRDARMHKVLAHKYLFEYDVSIWVDGNIVVRGDVNELIDEYLGDVHMAIYDKRNNEWDPRDCVYEELDALLEIGERRGRHKDDPEVMKAQVERYRKEGYPEHNGMIISMIMFRRHNEQDVIEAMEMWWSEIEKGSRRDQLSYNYAVWKTGLEIIFLPGDSRDNKYFKYVYHKRHQKSFLERVLAKIRSYGSQG